jgi:sodium pump decarboxylase gamma subunit
VFSLTACGGKDVVSEYQTYKLEYAEQYAVDTIIPTMESFISGNDINDLLSVGYTAEEWENLVATNLGFETDGMAFVKGIESFVSGSKEMGGITSFGEVTSVVDDDTIIVNAVVNGTLRNGQVEMIFSNDYFMKLESCTLNLDASFGDLMTKAALNTLLGMGSVFAVLILIMFIISLFAYIPKVQALFAKKAEKEAPKAASAPAAPVVEEAAEEVDDYALVAVIAAAIAAYEGQSTTDGFVVRSIKKSRRR